jgi:hypothetical protein
MQNIPNKKWTEIPRKRKIEKDLAPKLKLIFEKSLIYSFCMGLPAHDFSLKKMMINILKDIEK